MKHLIVLALLAFLVPACGSAVTPPAPTYIPLPTLTPYPSQTPYPTHTPLPTLTSFPTQTPYPTQTPLPTQRSYPTPTRTATPARPTSAPSSVTPLAIKNVESPTAASKCIAWNAVPSHIGETTCVRGNVTSTYKDTKSRAFFIDFDDSLDSFYAVTFKYTWDDLEGKCVEISGTIAPYKGRPQIVVENRSQVELCK